MNPSAAAFIADATPDGPLRIDLSWRAGDTWSSREWAVLIEGATVDLTKPGWAARAQVRAAPGDEDVAASWSSAPASGQGTIRTGSADVTFDDGTVGATSTVQLRHTPAVSRGWGAFVGDVECEVYRIDPGAPAGSDPAESYTIAAGSATALRDVSR